MERLQYVVRAGVGVAMAALIVGNIIFFVVLFPSSPWQAAAQTTTFSASHLPVQADAFLPPPAPAFLGRVTAGDISLTSKTPSARVLLRRRADHEQPLASLTKLMTAYVILQHDPEWNKEIIFTKEDQRGGARTPLTPGAKITLGDLWKLGLIASDNDAMAALVHGLGFTDEDFAALMNDQAKQLGLLEMQFAEPTGLSPDNEASARDFASFARLAFSEPRIRDTVATPITQVTINGTSIRVLSSDQLLKFHPAGKNGWSFVAAKTGFVDESGYNIALLATATNGSDILLVMLGSQSVAFRATEADELLAWAATQLVTAN